MATSVAVAGSQEANQFAVIDFTSATSPVSVLVTPPFSGGCVVDCYGSLACAGNLLGGEIAVYDISNPASPSLQGSISSNIAGIGAISFDGSRVLAGEMSGQRLLLVDFLPNFFLVITLSYPWLDCKCSLVYVKF